MARVALLVALFSLGVGCVTAGEDGTDPSDPPTVASARGPDLHNAVLRVPIADGSALVEFNVSRDMWVRPFMGTPAPGGYRMTPATTPTYWVICPWVRFFEVPAQHKVSVLTFWRDGSALSLTGNPAFFDDGTTEGRCTGSMAYDTRVFGVAADEPRDGVIVLAISLVPLADEQPRGAVQPLTALVGVASEPCEKDSGVPLCAPQRDVGVAPLLTGNIAVYSSAAPEPCDDCGFTVSDERTAGRGAVTIDRTATIAVGITSVYVGFGTNTVHAELSADPDPIAVDCTDRAGNAWLNLVSFSSETPEFLARIDYSGISNGLGTQETPGTYPVWMLEVPLDLRAVGLEMRPFDGAFSGWQSPLSERTTKLC